MADNILANILKVRENSLTVIDYYQDSVYYAFINMTHIGFGNLITILRDQAVDTKLGPWMLAYRFVTID